MRILRWALLALYLLIILGLFGMYLVVSAGESIFWLFLAMSVLFVVSQVVMLASAGTSDLCKPARRSRSAVPVIIAALMMGILVVGLLSAVIEYASHEWEFSA